jgi:hypothetical protein
MNDAYADEQRKHDATTSQLRAEAAGREAALQERSRQAAELAQQMEASRAALADEQRKAESFRQLHQTTTQQLDTLRHTHTVGGCGGSYRIVCFNICDLGAALCWTT